MTTKGGEVSKGLWNCSKRAVALGSLVGSVGLATWGGVQLVDGVCFSGPNVEAYPSHSTSDPAYIRDAKAQGQDIGSGIAHTMEGFSVGVGTLLAEDFGLAALVLARPPGRY